MKLKKLVNEYYVNPDDMWEQLDDYYNNIKSNPEYVMSSELGTMIDDIATKLGYLPRFINYSYKSEMIGDARHKMVKAVCDTNFTLWKDYRCTPILNDGGKDFVIVWNAEKKEWDDKRTYLKEWDVVVTGEDDLSIPPFEDIQLMHPFVNYIQFAKSEKTNVWLKCTKVFTHGKNKFVRAWDDKNKEWFPERFPVTKDTNIVPRSVPDYFDDVIGQHPCNHTVTLRNNPFSYFTRVAYHAFVNRIKKEKKVDEVLHKYQEKVYEDMYASGGGWENVKRQKNDEDESYTNSNGDDITIDAFYKEENEVK